MNLQWQTEEERLLKLMRIPPKKKLEWLAQMHKFILKSSSSQTLRLRWKLRDIP